MMKNESGRMRSCGEMCGGMPHGRFCRRIKSMKNKREGDGAMAVGGHHKTGGHNNQPKFGVGHERDIGEGTRLRRNVWEEAFCNRLVAANEATKN